MSYCGQRTIDQIIEDLGHQVSPTTILYIRAVLEVDQRENPVRYFEANWRVQNKLYKEKIYL